MAEITLGDYTGYILLEMIKAREMADAYSRAVAERYAADDVMRHFAVPRFKVPKMELTIPVLISGARFKQVVRFDFTEDDFVRAMQARAAEVRTRLLIRRRPGIDLPGPIGPLTPGPVVRALPAREVKSVEALAKDFYEQLVTNADPLRSEHIVTVMWDRIFWSALGVEKPEAEKPGEVGAKDPRAELLAETTREVLELVESRTVIDKTAIDSLLINPETNVVKNGSSDSSVFTVSAELLEEAFYLRTVREEGTEQVTTIVEFE